MWLIVGGRSYLGNGAVGILVFSSTVVGLGLTSQVWGCASVGRVNEGRFGRKGESAAMNNPACLACTTDLFACTTDLAAFTYRLRSRHPLTRSSGVEDEPTPFRRGAHVAVHGLMVVHVPAACTTVASDGM
jgi:hypothetical protein